MGFLPGLCSTGRSQLHDDAGLQEAERRWPAAAIHQTGGREGRLYPSRERAPPPSVDPDTFLPLASLGHMLPSQLSSATRGHYARIPQSHFPLPTAAPGHEVPED